MAVFLGWLSCWMLYVLIAAVSGAYLFWEYIEKLLHRRLEAWASRKLGVVVSADVARLRFQGIELQNVHIGNSAGEFSAPYFLQLRLFRLRVEGLFRLLTLPGIVPLFGGVFAAGFCTRTIETVEVVGLEVFVEDRKVEDDRTVSNCSFVYTARQQMREGRTRRKNKVQQRRSAFRQKWGADKDQEEEEKQEEQNEEEAQEEVSLDELGSTLMESFDNDKPDGERRRALGERLTQRLDRFRKRAGSSPEDSKMRLEAATANHIGCITFKDWSVQFKGRRLQLSEEGWELRGFIGSRADLVRIMSVKLLPRLVRQGVKEQLNNLGQNVKDRVSDIRRGVSEKLQGRREARQEKATERLEQRRERREERPTMRQRRQEAGEKVGGFLQRFGRGNNQQRQRQQQEQQEQSPQSQQRGEDEEQEGVEEDDQDEEEEEEEESPLQQDQQQQDSGSGATLPAPSQQQQLQRE